MSDSFRSPRGVSVVECSSVVVEWQYGSVAVYTLVLLVVHGRVAGSQRNIRLGEKKAAEVDEGTTVVVVC